MMPLRLDCPFAMLKFFETIANHPRPVLLAAGLLVLVMAPGMAGLRLRTDGQALVPPGDPAIRADVELRSRFAATDSIAVTVTTEHPEGIFNESTLALVRDLTAGFSALPEVADVMSLATEKRDRVFTGSLNFRTFLEPFPSNPSDFDQIRADVRAVELLNGTLVSIDENSTAVLVGVTNEEDRLSRYDQILAVIETTQEALSQRSSVPGAIKADPGRQDRIRIVGAPVAESRLGHHVLADLALLIPAVMAVMATALYLLGGSFWLVALGVVEVTATLIFTFGLMGYCGVPIFLTTAILPVTLTAVAVADEVHIFGHYQSRGETLGIPKVMMEMAAPVTITSLTTAIAFLSFLSASIEPIRYFGLFQAIGVIFAMVWSLVVTPAALTALGRERLLGVAKATVAPPPRRGHQENLLAASAKAAIGHHRKILYVAGALAAAAAFGAARIEVQDSWVGGFSPRSEFYRASVFVDEHFFGTHQLLVAVNAGGEPADSPTQIPAETTAETSPGPPQGPQAQAGQPNRLAIPRTDQAPASTDRLLEPQKLALLGEYEAMLRSLPGVGGVLGPKHQMEIMGFLLSGRAPERRRLPRSKAHARRTLDFMEQLRGPTRRGQTFDASGNGALVRIFMKDANYQSTAAVMKASRDFEAQHFAPAGLTLGFGGDLAVSQAMIPAIVSSQMRSLGLTLLGVWVIASLLTGSLAQGFACLTPAAFTTALVFGGMGWLGVPLGVATSIFSAVVLGVGIDFAAHLTVWARRAANQGLPLEPALVSAAISAGRTISIDAVAVAAGFAVLLLSRVPINARLGALVATSLALCLVITLGVLPALLAWWRPTFLSPNTPD